MMPRRIINPKHLIFAGLVVLIFEFPLAGCRSLSKSTWKGQTLSHGQVVNIENYLVSGQITVFDFYSVHCPACESLSPVLEKLDKDRADITLVKVDVDRPGAWAIDWGSPVVRYYEIHSLPHVKIYDQDGHLMAEGDGAIQKVIDWSQDAAKP